MRHLLHDFPMTNADPEGSNRDDMDIGTSVRLYAVTPRPATFHCHCHSAAPSMSLSQATTQPNDQGKM